VRLLLDSHIIIALLERRLTALDAVIAQLLEAEGNTSLVSVASLWEVAIKSRLGKLQLSVPVARWKSSLTSLGVQILPIETEHVLAEISPELRNKDPFDRLFLGICAAENMRLVTADGALINHPLAWRPFPL